MAVMNDKGIAAYQSIPLKQSTDGTTKMETDKKLSHLIMEHLQKSTFFPVLLSPKSGQKPGAVDNMWKVAVNVKLESDL